LVNRGKKEPIDDFPKFKKAIDKYFNVEIKGKKVCYSAKDFEETCQKLSSRYKWYPYLMMRGSRNAVQTVWSKIFWF